MKKMECKIELFRITKPRSVASKELEGFINGYLKNGWSMKSLMFHQEILAYEIVFTRKLAQGESNG